MVEIQDRLIACTNNTYQWLLEEIQHLDEQYSEKEQIGPLSADGVDNLIYNFYTMQAIFQYNLRKEDAKNRELIQRVLSKTIAAYKKIEPDTQRIHGWLPRFYHKLAKGKTLTRDTVIKPPENPSFSPRDQFYDDTFVCQYVKMLCYGKILGFDVPDKTLVSSFETLFTQIISKEERFNCLWDFFVHINISYTNQAYITLCLLKRLKGNFIEQIQKNNPMLKNMDEFLQNGLKQLIKWRIEQKDWRDDYRNPDDYGPGLLIRANGLDTILYSLQNIKRPEQELLDDIESILEPDIMGIINQVENVNYTCDPYTTLLPITVEKKEPQYTHSAALLSKILLEYLEYVDAHDIAIDGELKYKVQYLLSRIIDFLIECHKCSNKGWSWTDDDTLEPHFFFTFSVFDALFDNIDALNRGKFSYLKKEKSHQIRFEINMKELADNITDSLIENSQFVEGIIEQLFLNERFVNALKGISQLDSKDDEYSIKLKRILDEQRKLGIKAVFGKSQNDE